MEVAPTTPCRLDVAAVAVDATAFSPPHRHRHRHRHAARQGVQQLLQSVVPVTMKVLGTLVARVTTTAVVTMMECALPSQPQ